MRRVAARFVVDWRSDGGASERFVKSRQAGIAAKQRADCGAKQKISGSVRKRVLPHLIHVFNCALMMRFEKEVGGRLSCGSDGSGDGGDCDNAHRVSADECGRSTGARAGGRLHHKAALTASLL